MISPMTARQTYSSRPFSNPPLTRPISAAGGRPRDALARGALECPICVAFVDTGMHRKVQIYRLSEACRFPLATAPARSAGEHDYRESNFCCTFPRGV